MEEIDVDFGNYVFAPSCEMVEAREAVNFIRKISKETTELTRVIADSKIIVSLNQYSSTHCKLISNY